MLPHLLAGFMSGGSGEACLLIGGSGLDAFNECSDPCTSTADVDIRRNGTYDATTIAERDWITASCQSASVGDDYEVRMVIDFGDNPTSGPALGSFHTINTLRRWRWQTSSPGGHDANFTLTIREIADTSNSVTITGSAHTLVE